MIPKAGAASTSLGRNKLAALVPQVPLALTLGLVGLLKIVDGLKLPLARFRSVEALSSLEESMSAVAGTAEVILGGHWRLF